MSSTADESKRTVEYYFHENIGGYYFGNGHPMKPFRVLMTHNLVLNYTLYRHMNVNKPERLTEREMTKFHSDEYIRFLRRIGLNYRASNRKIDKFNVGGDTPTFEGVFEYCQIVSGASVGAAIKLNKKECDIVINWSGGNQHARSAEASGFCHVNDVVLAILELLKHHQRVLYLDIDVHHCNGVEEAFYTTDRVMTVSFHRYGNCFPGTGNILDRGARQGECYAVNVPLLEGIDDDGFESIFQPVVEKVIETYRPNMIVLQCGADSLANDPLGGFNLTTRGHGNCVQFVRKLNLPLMLLGGGGFNIRDVARCWTHETAIACGTRLSNSLPINNFWEHYAPKYELHTHAKNMKNPNTVDYLESIKTQIFENLRSLQNSPSVPLQPIVDDLLDEVETPEPNVDERLLEVDTINDPNEETGGDNPNYHIAQVSGQAFPVGLDAVRHIDSFDIYSDLDIFGESVVETDNQNYEVEAAAAAAANVLSVDYLTDDIFARPKLPGPSRGELFSASTISKSAKIPNVGIDDDKMVAMAVSALDEHNVGGVGKELKDDEPADESLADGNAKVLGLNSAESIIDHIAKELGEATADDTADNSDKNAEVFATNQMMFGIDFSDPNEPLLMAKADDDVIEANDAAEVMPPVDHHHANQPRGQSDDHLKNLNTARTLF